MKKVFALLWMIVAIVTPSTVLAQEAEAPEENVAQDSIEIKEMPAPLALLQTETEPKPDPALEEIGKRLDSMEGKINSLSRSRASNFDFERAFYVFFVVGLVFTFLVLLIFKMSKYRYSRLEKKYEIEKMWIEKGGEYPIRSRQSSVNRFVMWVLVASFGLLAWFGLSGMSSIRHGSSFFAKLFSLAVIVGMGYVVYRLFLFYIQRRDQEGQNK